MYEITVIGEALVDIVPHHGSTAEIPGGGPANVALGLGRLGVPVEFMTWLGRDERGRCVTQHLEASGVHLTVGSHGAARTSTAEVELDASGQPRYHFELSWELPAEAAPNTPWVHIGSIGAFLEPGASRVLHIVETSRRAGRTVCFDPNVRPALMPGTEQARTRFKRLASCTNVLKLSDEDADWLYPGLTTDAVIDRLHELGPVLVVLTRGATGSVLSTTATRVEVGAVRTDVVDTVGAGDSYMAALLWQLLRDRTGEPSWSQQRLGEMGQLCARAAALTVGREGAALPSLDQLSPFLP